MHTDVFFVDSSYALHSSDLPSSNPSGTTMHPFSLPHHKRSGQSLLHVSRPASSAPPSARPAGAPPPDRSACHPRRRPASPCRRQLADSPECAAVVSRYEDGYISKVRSSMPVPQLQSHLTQTHLLVVLCGLSHGLAHREAVHLALDLGQVRGVHGGRDGSALGCVLDHWSADLGAIKSIRTFNFNAVRGHAGAARARQGPERKVKQTEIPARV